MNLFRSLFDFIGAFLSSLIGRIARYTSSAAYKNPSAKIQKTTRPIFLNQP